MKKFISVFLTTAILLSTTAVFAETETETETTTGTAAIAETTPTPAPTQTDTPEATPEATSEPEQDNENTGSENTVSVTATIAKAAHIKSSTARLELFDTDGKSLGEQTAEITPETDKVTFVFTVTAYEIGKTFTVKAKDGLDSIIYYEDTYHTDAPITLPTYKYIDANGNEIKSTDIAVTINPLYDKFINLYYDGTSTPTSGARVIDGNAMVPARALAEFIGFNVRYDEDYNVEVISLNGKDMYFNIDTAYTTVFGTELFAPYPTVMIDGTVYISLRTFADAIGSTLTVKDYMTHLDINMEKSSFVEEYFNQLPVNRWGISSRTNYMVWVSLSEYKVRLYQGRQGHWKPMLEATCAIGAPGTPTVTGSFEYKYKDRWNYGSYYVGPCLVFYRGYALHSVLLNNNNTERDGRVGVKISHGCIRLKKKDIDFIANTIPVGTRIYITP